MIAATVAALALCVALSSAGEGKQPVLSDLAWLAGSWTASQGALTVEEHWTTPSENAIVGMGRTLEGGRTLFFEFLRIEARKDGVFYVGQPGGKPGTDFKLTSYDGQEVVFENPQHDFPKRIRYRREADGSVTARVDAGAAAAEAKEAPQEFRYQRFSSVRINE